MGTIEDKLRYLAKTKKDLMNALKSKGVEIDESTPFNEYDTMVKAIQGEDLDTSDATATADDILQGKTAYVNKEKLEGTIGKYDGSYSGNADGGIVITDIGRLFYQNKRLDIAQELIDMCGAITGAMDAFGYCSELTEINLSKLDLSQCTTMTGMFRDCSNLLSVDVGNWDTKNVVTMSYLFRGCSSLTNIDVSKWNTNNVTTMNEIFNGCRKFTNIDVSKWNTSKVTNMSYFVVGCTNLEEIDVSNFDTKNVTNISYMFQTCPKLTELNLSNFDLSKVTYVTNMLKDCTKLTNLQSFKNLGKGYTQKTTNYSNYTFDISNVPLTHESLIDLITNGLYDLNLTYDVANGGTLYTQSLKLGSTNIAKLEATEEGQAALVLAAAKRLDCKLRKEVNK